MPAPEKQSQNTALLAEDMAPEHDMFKKACQNDIGPSWHLGSRYPHMPVDRQGSFCGDWTAAQLFTQLWAQVGHERKLETAVTRKSAVNSQDPPLTRKNRRRCSKGAFSPEAEISAETSLQVWLYIALNRIPLLWGGGSTQPKP